MYFVHTLICTNNSEMQRHWLSSLTAFLMEKWQSITLSHVVIVSQQLIYVLERSRKIIFKNGFPFNLFP